MNTNPTPVTTTAEDAQEVASVPLPCPFCGHSGLSFSEGSTFRWLVAACEGCGASAGETRIQTLGEGARAEWRAQAQRDAIAEWNKRAPVAVATSDAERAALPPAFAKLADAKTLAKVLKMNIVSGVLAPLAAELLQSLEEMALAAESLPIDFKQATDQGGWQLVPKEPTPEIIAAAALAVWPVASAKDIEMARKAAPLVLMAMNLGEGFTADSLAASLATMAPAYRAMLAAAPTLLGVADGDAVGGKSGGQL